MDPKGIGVIRGWGYFKCLFVLVLLSAGLGLAEVRLPAVIGDNMVLQRRMEVPIWGWADPGEEVTVSIDPRSRKRRVAADKDGKWMVKIKPPASVGPHEITISGENTITISNVLVSEPVAVRYAWRNEAQGSLFNTESLPASSFRTDDWPGATFGRR